jgi:cytochrome bd-type quinol oxidase subunit 2
MQTESSSAYKYNLSTRGILGGLFVGIGAAVINLAFDFMYRKITGYEFAQYVNINSIIFFTIPTLVVAGIVYSLTVEYLKKKGAIIYMVLAAILTTVVAFIPLGPNMMPSGEAMPASARGLTMGIEIITGVLGTFALPYFAEHPGVWGD